jgi:hypothetical protein
MGITSMLRILTLATLLSWQPWRAAEAAARFDASTCTLTIGDKSFELHGSYQIVESFADFKVQVVTSFADLKVKRVSSFADSCGEWQEVSSFADFKIQLVQSFPDLEIVFVDSFPGAD